MLTEQILTRRDGTRFRVEFHAGADEAAPLLLITPAMGVKAGYYGPLVQALAAEGYNVALSELRGHEAAPDKLPGWGHDFGYHDLAFEDLPLAIEAAKARFPRAPLYLLGHSLGGQLSAVYAANHPDSVRGLILIACCTVHWKYWGFPFLLYAEAVALAGRLIGHFPGKRFRFAGREARTLMADWTRQARSGRFHFGRPKVNHNAALAEMTLPLLLISFTKDFFASKRSVDGLAALMPKTKLTRLHLDPESLGFQGIDHFRWVRQPALVLPAIKDWLAAQAA